jgi:hypothetical protein
MMNALSKFARLLGNYRYYRHLGIPTREAWEMAKVTLPD